MKRIVYYLLFCICLTSCVQNNKTSIKQEIQVEPPYKVSQLVDTIFSIYPNVYVNDIIHKTKLITDEKGIEGAAASAVMIMCGAALEEPKKPKEFIADEPFSFYVFTNNVEAEEMFTDIDLLFYGQNVK